MGYMKKLLSIICMLLSSSISIAAEELYLNCSGRLGDVYENYKDKTKSFRFDTDNVKIGVSIKNNLVHISGSGDVYYPIRDMQLCKNSDIIAFDGSTCKTEPFKTSGKFKINTFISGEYHKVTQELFLNYSKDKREIVDDKSGLETLFTSKKVMGEFICKEVKLNK